MPTDLGWVFNGTTLSAEAYVHFFVVVVQARTAAASEIRCSVVISECIPPGSASGEIQGLHVSVKMAHLLLAPSTGISDW